MSLILQRMCVTTYGRVGLIFWIIPKYQLGAMQPIFMQFSEAETAIIALLSIMTILLVILVLRFNKKFSELYYKTDEQSRHFHAQQENFQRTRAALLEAQANTQFKMEQRFG